MLYSILYAFSGTTLLFFLYLIFLLTRTAPATKREAYVSSFIASILWGLLIPISLLALLVVSMGSGAPGTKIWEVLVVASSILLCLLLSLYSLSNIWQKYSSEDYKSVVRFAAVPYISLSLVTGLIIVAKFVM